MKLGDATQIHIGVVDLKTSLTFYEKLGFRLLNQSSIPNPWAQLTDGQNVLLIDQDSNQYVGLGYFSTDAAARVAEMEKMGIDFAQKVERDGRLFMAIFISPDGLAAGLINHDPTGMYLPEGEPLTHCGKFGEFALGVNDLRASADYWGRLGFDALYETDQPYPWGIFSDGMVALGLHQTSEFKGPALTYFAPDSAERIQRLRAAGFAFYDMPGPDGEVANATLTGPDGETFFLFQGEI